MKRTELIDLDYFVPELLYDMVKQEGAKGMGPVVPCRCGAMILVKIGKEKNPDFVLTSEDPDGQHLDDLYTMHCPACHEWHIYKAREFRVYHIKRN